MKLFKGGKNSREETIRGNTVNTGQYFAKMHLFGSVHCTTLKVRQFSKGLFGVLEFSLKTNKRICRSSKNQSYDYIALVKTNSFICFLEEFEDTKSPFEII